jgi:hypothetical protein
VHVDRILARIELTHLLFSFTDPNHSGLKNFLDEDAFLRVDHLVEALFKSFVYFDVLDVENRVMLEKLLVGVPVLVVLHKLASQALPSSRSHRLRLERARPSPAP